LRRARTCQAAWSNFYEVGGQDAATLCSVANTLANVTGLIVPFLGVALRQRFNGSWMPVRFEAPFLDAF